LKRWGTHTVKRKRPLILLEIAIAARSLFRLRIGGRKMVVLQFMGFLGPASFCHFYGWLQAEASMVRCLRHRQTFRLAPIKVCPRLHKVARRQVEAIERLEPGEGPV
jgi:hypothetical protein